MHKSIDDSLKETQPDLAVTFGNYFYQIKNMVVAEYEILYKKYMWLDGEVNFH